MGRKVNTPAKNRDSLTSFDMPFSFSCCDEGVTVNTSYSMHAEVSIADLCMQAKHHFLSGMDLEKNRKENDCP